MTFNDNKIIEENLCFDHYVDIFKNRGIEYELKIKDYFHTNYLTRFEHISIIERAKFYCREEMEE